MRTRSVNIFAGARGSSRFGAFVLSLLFHFTVIMILIFFRFSDSSAAEQTNQASVMAVHEFLRHDHIIAKPVFEQISSEGSRDFAANGEIKNIFQANERQVEQEVFTSSESQALDISAQESIAETVEFFGSRVQDRKICYVVDRSGSMQGLFGRVKEELKQSIRSLRADQYFYIIFFGGSQLSEFGDGKLLRASAEIKSSACDYIDLVEPIGITNATEALERASKIRDNQGNSASVIYFLTDGFDLSGEQIDEASGQLKSIGNSFSSGTRINTIGFWPSEDDKKLLEAIASQSGGEFVLVESEAK